MPRKGMVAAAVALALGLCPSAVEAQSVPSNALPTGGVVVGGQTSISQSGATMRIDQASARTAIDWQSFNIGAQASVAFNQPSASAIALNRVIGAGGSEILGRLSANGQVFLVNPNGILFGRGAQVDVGGLLASTLAMSPDEFLAGRYVLRGQGSAGSIVNQGTIRAPRGSVAFVAPSIVNDGLIEAHRGAVSLAAGNAATVEFMADGLVRIRVDEGALSAEIANNGVLRADGGSVTLSAKSLDSLASAVINNAGIIEARTVESVNGVVRLGGGDVYVAGTIDVSAADGVGGSAHILGERVAFLGSARVDASGKSGGGQVLIGGDLRGSNPDIRNAKYTYVGPDAVVEADARTTGDGGRVVVWSDDVTRVYGALSARGGAKSGDGGFIETSGRRYLEVERAPDIGAPAGRGGTWLLDPETINIAAASNSRITGSPPFQPVGGGISTLNVTTLNAALNAGGTVIVDTSGVGTGVGDINVNAPISKTSGSNATLELRAHNDINLNQSITSTNNPLNIVLNADLDGAGGGVVNVGNVTLNGNGGTINASAEIVNVSGTAPTFGSPLDVGTLNFSSGTVTATAPINVTTAFNWAGGTMRGAGTTIVQGTLAINGPIELDTGRVLDVQGNATWSAGSINLNASNAPGAGKIISRGSFATSFDGTMFAPNFGTADPSTGLFENRGTFLKDGGAGTSSIQNRVENSGTIEVRSGTLSLSDFPANAGAIALTNATLSTSGNPLTNVASGVIQGNGTLDLGVATLTNDGTILAGTSPRTLNITGKLVLGPTSMVDVAAQSPWMTAGMDFDVLNVTGDATLGGMLNIVHLDGAAPPIGHPMQVINAASVTSAFGSVNLPSSSSYTVLYSPAGVTVRHDFTLGSTLPTPITGPKLIAARGFEPATVGTAGAPTPGAAIPMETNSGASLVTLSVRPGSALPDMSHLITATSELRRKKDLALANAEHILERDPAAADLPACAGEVSGSCIAERPAAREEDGVAPERAGRPGIERKIALLIGIAEYRHPIPRLDSPLKDIAELGRLYRERFGYEVRTLANADKASIVREVNRLIRETSVNDSVVVLYAGHGHVVDKTGRGYWIPAGAGGNEPTQWISNSDIAKMLANIPARQVLLVSDSCYSGTLTREGRMEKSKVLRDPRAVLERRSVTVLSSGGEEPVADTGKDGHSVFAWHFLRTLGRVAQWSNGVDIYEQVADAVQLDFPQQPHYGAALGAGHEPGADYLFEVRRY